MQLTQGLRRSATLYRQRTATISAGHSRSYGELEDRVARLAGALQSRECRPGDRIAILAHNSDHYIAAYYAIAWAGCVSVPFNTRWARAEVEAAMEDARPVLVLTDAACAEMVQPLVAAGVATICMDNCGDGGSFDVLVASQERTEDRCGAGSDLLGIIYTGGTTGRSKGVMLSHDNVLTNFLILHAAEPYEPASVFLHTPPMFHLADVTNLFGMIMLGGTNVVLPGFEPRATVQAIECYKVSALVLVPTMIGMLCETLRQEPADMSSVTRLTYGASPISAAVLEQAMRALPNARFCQAYGQTELSPCATVLDHADHLAGKLRSAGRALPCVDLQIVDDDMRPLPQGQIGEIVARSPCMMLGYLNQPEVTAQTIVGGWLRTGDVGSIDEEGYLFLEDRKKDMIVSGGENIYSAEVENALLTHADVLQCAVIGIPSDRWGESVHAVLYMRPGSSVGEDQLAEHCEGLIANYKRPKSFDLRTEPLPLSGVGKILKTALREPFWAKIERNIN